MTEPQRPEDASVSDALRVEALSAVTLAIRDMARAVRFYTSLGFRYCMEGKKHAFPAWPPGTAT